jgi:hypothetical protein
MVPVPSLSISKLTCRRKNTFISQSAVVKPVERASLFAIPYIKGNKLNKRFSRHLKPALEATPNKTSDSCITAYEELTEIIVENRAVNPHWFQCGSGSVFFYLNDDPDPDPDPRSQPNPDPYRSGSGFWSDFKNQKS